MKKNGFKLSAQQIYSTNKASMKDAVAIFGGGCTAEIISNKGLILTNHHCGFSSIAALSSVENDYLKNGILEREPTVTPSTETTELLGESVQSQSEISVAGKGIFTSFLKCLTAIGKIECQPNWNFCPDDFLLYYFFPDVESEIVKQIFSRLKMILFDLIFHTQY